LVRALGVDIPEYPREKPCQHAYLIDPSGATTQLLKLNDASEYAIAWKAPLVLQYDVRGHYRGGEFSTKGKFKIRWTSATTTLFPLAISADGTWFAASGPHGHDPTKMVLRLHSVDTGAELSKYTLSHILPQLVIAPNGELFASIYFNTIRHWNRATPRQSVASCENASGRNYSAIVFHPSGQYLAATSDDHTVQLYDTTSWAVAKIFTWEIGRLRSIAFSADGCLAAAGSDGGKIIVWDLD
jgi:WD40 repeat protein